MYALLGAREPSAGCRTGGWGASSSPYGAQGQDRVEIFAFGCGLMKRQDAVDGLELGRLDQTRMGDRHGMERPLQLTRPKAQEFQQHWEIRREIVLLPDVCLKKARVVGQAVKNRRRCQPVPLKLTHKRLRDHEISSQRSASLSRASAQTTTLTSPSIHM